MLSKILPKRIFNVYFHGSRENKRIALTFDDGPSEVTKELLKILKKEDSKATFFVLGKKIKNNKEIIKEMIKQGLEVGNHSYDHLYLMFKSVKIIKKQILDTDKELDKIGVKTNLFRPPYLSIGLFLLIICKKLKKKIITADVISYDYLKLTKEKIIKNVLNNVKNGSIIGFHDYCEDVGTNEKVIEVIKDLIPMLKSEGYELVSVSELLV